MNTARHDYIEGLRQLADILETTPGLQLPVDGQLFPISISFWTSTAREDMAATVRSFPGVIWAKQADGAYFRLDGKLAGLHIQLAAYRDAVCTRKVTGTEELEVEEIITPAVTRKTVKTVEVVEWDCQSLLAPADQVTA